MTLKSSTTGSFATLTRRGLLGTIPALLLAPAALAQNPAPIQVRKLHSCTIRVSSVRRSLQFYQDIFGAAVQARQGGTVCLRIGDGPQFLAISPLEEGEQPGFAHIGLSVANFDPQAVQDALAGHGVMPGEAPVPGQPRLELALRSWLIQRRQSQGGAFSGTPELFFADAEGVIYHLVSENYCGGSGLLGESCPNIERASQDGFFELVDLSHFTNFMANRERANDFMTTTFGKTYQAYQGPGSPVIGVGDGIQFLMYVGGAQPGRPDNPGRIDHVCLSVRDFDVDSILQRLTEYGLQPRQDAANTEPLMHWISMRMPDRGGAEGGTPELYFSDPDGIRIQLQDPGYCGGTGYLGNRCPALA